MKQEYKRYSVWVYDAPEMIQVFGEPTPNTKEIWFEFYEITLVQWKHLEQDCLSVVKINEHEQSFFYNFKKIKIFCLKHLLKDTNYPVEIVRDGEELTDESLENVLKIHPRIWREIFNKFSIFNDEKSPEEEKRIAKECSLIFGAGKTVNNPHPDIILYCDMIAFWDKFGLNYFDIQNLPKGLFYTLKRMIDSDNAMKNKEPANTNNNSGGMPMRGFSKGVPNRNRRIMF